MDRAEYFRGWCYYYLNRHMGCKFSSMHREWMELTDNLRVGIAAPRSFAKSSVCSFFYPLFRAVEDAKEILILSATATLAETFLIKIMKEVEENRLLISDYGLRKGSIWRNDTIEIKIGSRTCKIQAKGAEAQIRGFRPDVVIVDDLENDEAVWSEDQRNKLKEWFWKALVGTLNPNSQLFVVGTLLHPMSFLSELVNQPPDGWRVKKYQALVDDKSVWEEQWPTPKLLQRRDEIGVAAFEAEYMNNPIPDEWRVFHDDHIRYYDTLPKCEFFTSVDPAASISASSDFTAVMTVGIDPMGNWYIAECTRKRILPNEIIDTIFDHYERWKPKVIGIEEVGFQQMLRYYFDMECAKRRIFPNVKTLKLDVSEKGRRKRFRIESLEPLFKAGKVHLLKEHVDLKGELLSFPTGRYDDQIDALASIREISWVPEFKATKNYPAGSWGAVLERQKLKKRKMRTLWQ